MASEYRQAEDEWFKNYMKTVLGSIGSGVLQSYSISIVPEELNKTSTDDAYLPKLVSIGPRYRGSSKELLHMEEKKLHCFLSLLHRGKTGATDSFQKCSDCIWNLDDQIRASYVDDINFKHHELVKIMLVDACFLLELLISKGFDHQLPSSLNISSYSPPAAKVLQNDDVLSDLIIFENQIPIFILHKLAEILFPDFFGDFVNRALTFNNLFLSVLGYSVSEPGNVDVYSPHLLDFVHSFVNNINKYNNQNDYSEISFHSIDIDGTPAQHAKEIEEKLKLFASRLELKRCASRLEAAGVSFQLEDYDEYRHNISCFPLIRNFFAGILISIQHRILKIKQTDMNVEEGVRGLNFEFKFKEGKFEIAQLLITNTTKTKWRNVIAWEHHKMDWKNISSNIDSNKIKTCGKFTLAALIFNDLICCADDVKLLKDKGIIVDHMKMSNKELKEFFRTMAFGINPEIVDLDYVKMIDDLNNYYYAVFLPIRIWKTLCHLFIYRLEWLIKFMKRDYNFVAAVVSFVTIVQTVYAIIAYHLPK